MGHPVLRDYIPLSFYMRRTFSPVSSTSTSSSRMKTMLGSPDVAGTVMPNIASIRKVFRSTISRAALELGVINKMCDFGVYFVFVLSDNAARWWPIINVLLKHCQIRFR